MQLSARTRLLLWALAVLALVFLYLPLLLIVLNAFNR